MLAPLIDLSMIKGFHVLVMFSWSLSKIGWILFSNAKETLQKMLARTFSYRGKCKYWIKKLINCCFSQNIRKRKLTAYLMYLCYFFSYLYKYLNRYWANQLDTFIITSTKKAIFIAMHLTKHMAYHYYQDCPSLIIKRH